MAVQRIFPQQQFFLHSNQAKFHVKPHSAPETEQNEPNFKSLKLIWNEMAAQRMFL